MLGANPYAANGSLATAPDWPGRIKALLARGGRLVVVDPRRTRTAEEASEHVAIRPGSDAFLLMAMLNVLATRNLVDLGRLEPYVSGVDQVLELAATFSPEVVAPLTGLDAETIERLATELAQAPTACVYGRMGTTTAEFGTLTSWLGDVLNVVPGTQDRPGCGGSAAGRVVPPGCGRAHPGACRQCGPHRGGDRPRAQSLLWLGLGRVCANPPSKQG
jgi:anaerobic selenocysteine-containing dehydrogenase